MIEMQYEPWANHERVKNWSIYNDDNSMNEICDKYSSLGHSLSLMLHDLMSFGLIKNLCANEYIEVCACHKT